MSSEPRLAINEFLRDEIAVRTSGVSVWDYEEILERF